MAVKSVGAMETFTLDPNTLTPELIQSVKEELQTQGIPPVVYKYTFEDNVFIFRPLYRFDWVQIESFVSSNPGVKQEVVDQKVCERCLLWPFECRNPMVWDFQLAGIQSSLARQISLKSGFVDFDADFTGQLRLEPLFEVEPPKRPSQEVIDSLKDRYNFPLKLVNILNEMFIVRPVNRSEWKQLSSGSELQDFNLEVAKRATIWSAKHYPEDVNFNDCVAGVVATLSQVIMEASGFAVEPTVEAL